MSKSLDMPRGSPASEARDGAVRERAVLLADPDTGSARRLAEALREAGEEVELTSGGPGLARLLDSGAFAVVLADDRAAQLSDLLRARENAPAPSVILLSGFGSVEDSLEAVRRGVFEVVGKPADPEQVVLAVRRALDARALADENRKLKADLAGRFQIGSVLSGDARMQRVLATADSVAPTRATVLVLGESGTGKSLLARAIHQRSGRASAPFVEVSCGSIPAALLESELFGHARGAFTGASRDRAGKFEAAGRGTIFLDEIGCAPPELQVKLLRVLQDRTFERLGESRTRTSEARVIAATNEDLSAAVAEGRFREDLYWRIRVVRLELPPLRERAGDVPLLAETFLQRYSAEHGRGPLALSPACLPVLLAWPWPGNVRELQHAIERAVLLAPLHGSGAEIRPEDLGLEAPRSGAGESAPAGIDPALAPDRLLSECLRGLFAQGRALTLREALSVPEREIIRLALELCGGSRKATARMLDVNRTTLFNKMRKYGLMGTRP
jgi:two-component system response regulator AtoC